MTVALRPMRWWDIEQIMPIETELFADESWSERMFWSELAQGDTRYYLVAIGAAAEQLGAASPPVPDGLLGYAGLCVYPDEAFVQTLAVRPSAQGRGVGRALLEALLAEAGARGRGTVGLEVRADNDGAQRLYRRYGFQPIARRRGYYQPSGVDAIVMQRTAGASTGAAS